MSELSDKVCCVVDHGLFMELAVRLARNFKRVLYFTPWEKGFPLLNDCVIGDGLEEIERIHDIWEHVNEIDLFVFPDIQHSGLQLHLQEMGKRVWGSRHGDSLELKRAQFKDTLAKMNLPVGKWRAIRGLDDLRAYLGIHEDRWVKISKYRGCMESWHHQNYEQSLPMLDHLAVEFGPLQNAIPFIVEDPLPTEIEVGYDGFCIDGHFPSLGMQGYEIKDEALIGSVQKYTDMPKEVLEINESLAPVLRDFQYRNFFSTEIRVVNGNPYFIDPCCRCPSPSIEIQYELWSNLGQCIWEGADGILIDPKPVGNFGVEAIIDHKGDYSRWRVLEIPDEVRQWTKLFWYTKHDGMYAIPPLPHIGDAVGVVVGIGDTIQQAIDHLNGNVDILTDKQDCLNVHVHALSDALEKIREAEKKGIEFTDQPVPKPETVMQ